LSANSYRNCSHLTNNPAQTRRNRTIESIHHEGTKPGTLDRFKARGGSKTSFFCAWSKTKEAGSSCTELPQSLVIELSFKTTQNLGKEYNAPDNRAYLPASRADSLARASFAYGLSG